MTPAFSEIWLDGEKAATMEIWGSDVGEKFDIDNMMKKDTGRGVVLPDSVEPIYGDR
jgi:sulfite reductase (ferredoxin)